MTGLVLRRAHNAEIAACAALYERVARATFTWVAAQTICGDDFIGDALAEEVSVAVADGRLAAVAAYYRPGDFLHSLYVDEGFRGRGVGRALLGHVEAHAQGAMTLKVAEPNRRAMAFYEREGFRVIEAGCDPGASFGWLRMGR